MLGALLRLRHRLAHLFYVNERDLFCGSGLPGGHDGYYLRCAGCAEEYRYPKKGGCQCARCLPRRAS